MARANASWLLLGVLLTVTPLSAQTPVRERPPHTLVAEVNLLDRASPPWLRGRWVVFSYRPATSARFVAVRFEHEDYGVLHPMDLNAEKVFVLVYQPPEGLDTLTYRISVDGMWMRDPANPDYRTDVFGTSYSRVDVSSMPDPEPTGPRVGADGRVTFWLRAEPGELVTLAGSFNHWDPFVHVMEEEEVGVYRLTLRLPAGVHYYYFLENGTKTLDPASQELRRSADGEIVNALIMPG